MTAKTKGPTARDVMTKKVTTVTADTTISSLLETLKTTKFSGFPVVDAGGKAVGLISQNDVLRALAAGTSQDRKAGTRLLEGAGGNPSAVLSKTVQDLMSPRIVSCAPGDPLSKVCKTMADARVHRVVVLDKGKVAGLVSATDVVRHVAKA
jgi:CBS domain-containing protein